MTEYWVVEGGETLGVPVVGRPPEVQQSLHCFIAVSGHTPKTKYHERSGKQANERTFFCTMIVATDYFRPLDPDLSPAPWSRSNPHHPDPHPILRSLIQIQSPASGPRSHPQLPDPDPTPSSRTQIQSQLPDLDPELEFSDQKLRMKLTVPGSVFT